MRLLPGLLTAALVSAVAFAGDTKPHDWTAQMGDIPFVVGIELGREEVAFTGRPPMLFFTSATDPWCPKFASRTWRDKAVLESVSGYTPVLVDADTAPKEFKEKYVAVMVPTVVWLDFDESQVFVVAGDADLQMFRMMADVAHDRCPDAKPPAEGYAALLALKKKLDDGAAAKDVKAQLAAIAEIRGVRLGAAVQKAANESDARLTKDGEAEIARANGLVAAKKKPDAKKALEKLVADYGADHAVAKKAQEILDQLAGKTKPKK